MHLRVGMALAAAVLLQAAPGARVQTREIEYRQGDTVLKGFIAWDDAAQGKRPGVLVVHEWWGLNQHARNQARRLAEAGYGRVAPHMFCNREGTPQSQGRKGLGGEVGQEPPGV